jgi:hypothetical protein
MGAVRGPTGMLQLRALGEGSLPRDQTLEDLCIAIEAREAAPTRALAVIVVGSGRPLPCLQKRKTCAALRAAPSPLLELHRGVSDSRNGTLSWAERLTADIAGDRYGGSGDLFEVGSSPSLGPPGFRLHVPNTTGARAIRVNSFTAGEGLNSPAPKLSGGIVVAQTVRRI